MDDKNDYIAQNYIECGTNLPCCGLAVRLRAAVSYDKPFDLQVEHFVKTYKKWMEKIVIKHANNGCSKEI